MSVVFFPLLVAGFARASAMSRDVIHWQQLSKLPPAVFNKVWAIHEARFNSDLANMNRFWYSSHAYITVNMWVGAAILLPPILLSILVMYEAKGTDDLSTFMNTRPLSSYDLVLSRWKTVSKAALYFAPLFLLTLLLPLTINGVTAPLLLSIYQPDVFKLTVDLDSLLLLLVYVSWKFGIDGQLFEQLSNRLISTTCTLVVLLAFPVLLWTVYRFMHHHEWMNILSFAILIFAISKVVALAITSKALMQRSIVRKEQLSQLTAVWTLIGIILSSLAISLVPSTVMPAWGVFAAVLLLMPGVRMAATPLALEKHRHQ